MKRALVVLASVAGAAVIITAIVVPCVLLIPSGEEKTTYTFDDLYSSDYNYKSIYPNWDKTDAANTKFFSMVSDKGVVRRDISDPYTDFEVLINKDGEGKTTAYYVSADAQYVYYRSNYKKVWRHSYTADFTIYKVGAAGSAGTKVTPKDFPTDGMIHHMEWSPTGHSLAFMYKWNVWEISNLDAATPIAMQITTDGQQNMVYNGIPDWVYEEEQVSSNNVLYWAPDSKSFSYLKTDETGVSLIEYSMYNEAQYPETIKIAYPKAGTTNPTVKLFVHTVGTLGTEDKEIVPAVWPTGDFMEYYFSLFNWLDASTCLVTWINRNQTYSAGNLCVKATDTWTCTTMESMQEEVTNGWVGNFGPFSPVWKGPSKDYFTIYARPDDGNNADGRWQIAMVTEGTSTMTWLTKTNYDIIGLNFYDNTNDFLYFTAAAPLPRQRHIYRVKSTDKDKTEPECLTCKVLTDNPTRCGWITPSFNSDFSRIIVNCRGYWIPMTVTMTIDNKGVWSDATTLEDNQELQNKVAGKKWPQKEYGEFKSGKYKKSYKYELFKPYDFDKSKKYPLLIEVYAGPEFQSVTDVWTRGWATTYMVSDKDIIVASVDGRGSAYEGYEFMQQVYHKLGQMEPVDQTDFAAYLANNDWIDENHVAIWGWSYGGYATSHSLGYDAGKTFKCGIAVAPLGDWRWYDSMYAERYMGWPESNVDGYNKASIITGHDLKNFKNSEYVLIHGTADDNVHFQSAAEMEKALVEADVDFDDFFYADQAHSINIGNANKHIYRQLSMRMGYCLGRSDTPYPG